MQRRYLSTTIAGLVVLTITQNAPGVQVDALAPAKNIYFIGNSYTGNGNLYTYVGALAAEAGWQTPTLRAATNAGSTLSDTRTLHKNNIQNGSNGSDWDVVVLQEQSQRPSAPGGSSDLNFFYTGALDWFDHTLTYNPNAQVVMYQTWARHPDADSGTYYPNYYGGANPAEMQSRVSTQYDYVADSYIPTNSTAADKTDVRVARVGEAWAENYTELYSGGMPLRLHAGDGSHQNSEGIYLTALILYSEIYLTGIDEIATNAGVNGVDAAEAAHLRDIAARMIPAAYTRIDGDANDDGIVDSLDLAFVNGNLGISTKRLYNGDLNADGLVNSLDIGIVQNAIAVPEPGSCVLGVAGLGALAILCRARRTPRH